MTRDDIDDLMRDNGIVVVGEAVYALCQLVAAREREECAKVCEEASRLFESSGHIGVCITNAIAIRARGE